MKTVLVFLLLFVGKVCFGQQGFLSVHSVSGNAMVYDDTVKLGITPLDSIPLSSGTHIVRIVSTDRMSWFIPPVVETLLIISNQLVVKTVSFPDVPENPVKAFINNDTTQKSNVPATALEGKIIHSEVPMYLTAAGTVISGTLAAYFKLKADRYYNDYISTGDESALDHVKSHDTASGIALVVCEINLGLLTYILLSR